MSELVRFSVSLEADLLEGFDHYCEENRYATRSEAVRQLLREKLTQEAWAADVENAAATLTVVYDHHRTMLVEQMLAIQHEHTGVVVATTHVHLDHDLCMEVIFLRGRPKILREIAARLRGLKGIRLGELVIATAQEGGDDHGHSHPHPHPHPHD